MEHENDGDTNCNWCALYSDQRIGIRTGGLGNKKTSGGYQNYNIVDIGHNTKKSSGDLRRFAVTPVGNQQLTLV